MSGENPSKLRDHAVVTGGAGFVGSHLVDSLLDDGYRVTSLDNYGSGRRRNVARHDNREQFTPLDHDVREPLPEFDTVDYIYNLASRASPADFGSHPIEIALTNSVGSKHVFDLACEHDATVVLASSSEVYGDPKVHPQHEGYYGNVNPRGPRAPYDESKRFAEALGAAYETQHDVDVRTIRVFNTYGPRMRVDDGRVVPTFITQALEGKELTVYGDGRQTRSFCYVTDLVDGIRRVAAAPGATGEAINLGSEREMTIYRLAEIVIDHVDSPSEITHRPQPANDPSVRRPNVEKAKRLLGWEAMTDLEVGLRRTIDYFRTLTVETNQ
ncbi:NAD-dependent epimerase/dehydratase family protein [Natronococcus occultus]|uniref:Nucleoside-diphosphate-sugar epimerase n=1 Tax=Natronococcus occultus SP4 TaxID=694430 RepID=L0K1X2_9EURY|nr:NAD-dependent epimerase/dehydratase family protein [Natronococcus occultus]AGB39282.1 nucleoside-diphosphate-sugar epimerase [Natronococcus occultus SP4]